MLDKLQINGKVTLKQIRSSCGMTQEEFAEYVGIPFTSYRRYENNVSNMEFGKLSSLCDKVGVSISMIEC